MAMMSVMCVGHHLRDVGFVIGLMAMMSVMCVGHHLRDVRFFIGLMAMISVMCVGHHLRVMMRKMVVSATSLMPVMSVM
jgi:ribosomal protein S4E